jgi:hypothetical protein
VIQSLKIMKVKEQWIMSKYREIKYNRTMKEETIIYTCTYIHTYRLHTHTHTFIHTWTQTDATKPIRFSQLFCKRL